MSKRVFEFSKPEELEIAGEKFTIDKSDEKALQFQKDYLQAKKTVEKMQSLDVEKATYEETVELYNQSKSISKTVIDGVLGEGAFDKLYEKSGKSLERMTELVDFLREAQSEKVEGIKQKRENQYVKKGNK